MVVALHGALVLLLLFGLKFGGNTQPQEYVMTLGGPAGNSEEAKPAKLVDPDLPTLPPPEIPSIMFIEANTAAEAAGSPNVTKPAEAIAEAHAFPALPAGIKPNDQLLVRLQLFIAENGSVVEVQILQSSGNQTLDTIAIDWVKKFWRYRPAMRGGQPIAETTTAILRFLIG